ncbi:uncharacterized protein LOC110271345 [Arachis ipaensis]|uniref:uncharacterized protein LOC110271345 n=1 Tax=Arachis ipaensis TaxID=130454 RepID=UPI000A2B2164|nr:uncharacterized protein LOC110271345 [Arachis ipaensis]
MDREKKRGEERPAQPSPPQRRCSYCHLQSCGKSSSLPSNAAVVSHMRERERETDSRGANHDRCRRSQARRRHHPRSCEEPLSCSCRCAPSSFPHPEPSICRHRYKGLSLEPRLSLSICRRCRSSRCCRRFGVAAIGATSGVC